MAKLIRTLVVTGMLLMPMTHPEVALGDTITGDAPQEAPPTQAEAAPPAPVDPLTLVWQDLTPDYFQASPLPVQGRAMYYNPNVFERVLDFRLSANHVTECAECIGYVALLRRGDLDRRVWLRREGKPAEGPFWVIDVAGKNHVGMLLERNWVVDVDYATAMRWKMNRPIPITVLETPTPDEFESSLSLPLNWNAAPVPAENFNWPAASMDTYFGDVQVLH